MQYASQVTLWSAALLALMVPTAHANYTVTPSTPEAMRIKQLDTPTDGIKNLDGTNVASSPSFPSSAQPPGEPFSLKAFLDTLSNDSSKADQLKMRMPFLPGMVAHSGQWNLALAPKAVRTAVSEGVITEDQAQYSFEQQMAFYEWTQQNPSRRYLFVNVPTYDLHFYSGIPNASLPIEHFTLDWESKSIVGRSTAPSPDQSLTITSIKYNPTWTPTRNMMRNSAILDDGGWNWEWIDQHNFMPFSHETGQMITWSQATQMDVDEFFFVEPAGPKNTLGQIKFETNSQNYIYLHDTNTPWYFERNQRAISSGCVRVEKPLELAALLLDANIAHIERQLENPKTHWERIEQTPFYFMYDIVEYDNEGQVVGVGDDPYGWYAEWLNPPPKKEIETFDMKSLDYEIKTL